ncbi:hypothetical protein DVT68_17280 [Dyella solisilvae]|uniref:Uncharacterized protein n=1 Tax=Dyella solisilvae TaxID=1920168 RepID=A0A370K4B2_9GAMM|nr:hypothetical protein [Dyella solisilvae]RDI97492.1 hypothetical protein DVT68_17280 [Dyella solisilvae]
MSAALALVLALPVLPEQVLASDSAPAMKCSIGPVTKQYGKTDWLVYGCEDGKSIRIVSAPKNKAVRFHFTFIADDDGYALHGEGQGDKRVTDAAFQELNLLSEKDVAALVAEVRKTSGS